MPEATLEASGELDAEPTAPPKSNGTAQPSSGKTPAEDRIADAIRRNVMSFVELAGREVPPREFLVAPAIQHPSLGVLSAWRGSGKTYIAMSLALALARGDDHWLGYRAYGPRTVLFVDGEMSIDDLQERAIELAGQERPDTLHFLSGEDITGDLGGEMLDLGNAAHREGLLKGVAAIEKAAGQHIDFVILDNWSALNESVDENDNHAVKPVNRMLVKLRYARHSVLMVCHDGKDGGANGPRGASDLVTAPNYTIRVSEKSSNDPEITELTFEWDKVRREKPVPRKRPLLLYAEKDERGAKRMILEPDENVVGDGLPKRLEVLRAKALNPDKTQDELGTQVGLKKQSVSDHLKKCRENGLLSNEDVVTLAGWEALEQHWPDIRQAAE